MTRTNDRKYRKQRAALMVEGVICVLCGQPIDLSLKWPDPMCFTADHITPVDKGGHNLGPLQPMHATCNRARGTKDLDLVRLVRHSRQHY
jgi:5-methylcytosine-specific restriction endonuclease McrA